ncbi:small acid-soluble spore protein I (minor) [Paenibacillus phyllosphaerae]|uniref:Small, acid-soluble spore protein I n=1 Tax=Paenibacillus phyllosphaerae TaxID=274593 RepID=A0A7W5B5E1_9BACL|nr:small acid-soluble spore protein SspI [Paenibacillus phyllosphaerae]MBB3114724.1 small acid-soluble spore protein I (minor) [Paenibacillus phyllosphaerae]
MKVTLDLRQAIIKRVQDKSGEELNGVITDSIGGDDRALPGLGVLFEMIWEDSTTDDQNKMVQTLYNHLHNMETANPSPS